MILPTRNIVIFPHNNPFAKFNKKPVVLSALSYLKYSIFKDRIIVITPFVENVGDELACIVVDKSHSKANDYSTQVIKILKSLDINSIEVHQNIKLATLIAKIFPHIKVGLIKHNEYLINRLQERIFFIRWYYKIKYLQYISNVFCISNYVKNTLIRHYQEHKDKFILLYNNYGHIDYNYADINIDNKANTIIFVGKFVQRKGASLILGALPYILKHHPNYKVILIGALFSGKSKYAKMLSVFIKSPQYAQYIASNRLVLLSNLTHMQVFNELIKAKIGLVTTIKPEPFGLVALEYVMAKCLVISSGSGGLKEITDNNALYLDTLTSNSLIDKIDEAIANYDIKYKNMAELAHKEALAKFNIVNLVKVIDNFRS